MNLQLDDVALFVRIVALGTLSAAARERNTPVSQVTRSLARLEAACSARLLHRSTHGLSLTDEGDTFLAHGRRLLDTSAELQSELTGKVSGPSGWVRISVSPIVAQAVIVPSLNGLYDRHPELHVDIAADDRTTDMAREGIDIAIRAGTLVTDTVVAHQIGQLTRSLYAAPAYLERWGMPRDVDELKQHRLIANSANPALNQWAMSAGRQARVFDVQAHTRTDNTAIVLALVQHGVGISRLIDIVAQPMVRSGLLAPVLPDDFATPALPIHAVMLQERHRLPKIRACIDYWAQWMAAIADGPARAKHGAKRSFGALEVLEPIGIGNVGFARGRIHTAGQLQVFANGCSPVVQYQRPRRFRCTQYTETRTPRYSVRSRLLITRPQETAASWRLGRRASSLAPASNARSRA